MKSRICLLMIIASIVFVACKKEPPPPPPTPPPPPPTPQQIADEIRTGTLQGLFTLVDANSFVPGEIGPGIAAVVRQAQGKHMATDWGRKGLSIVGGDLKDRLKKARDNKNWNAVKVLCDGLEALDPNDPRVARYREEATNEGERPFVKITGFYTDDRSKETRVFMDLTIPSTNAVEHVTQKKGEEFFKLRLDDIIGDRTGVRLIFIPTGESFEVPFKQ